MWTLFSASTDLDAFASQVQDDLDSLDIEATDKFIMIRRDLRAVRESKSRVSALRAACRKADGEGAK